MFFVATALLLTTAGVFAGKAQFDSLTLYVSNTGNAGSFIRISPTTATSFDGLTTSGASISAQAKITDQSGTSYGLYYATSSSSRVYAVSSLW